ncbi:hypothetical protein C171_25285, partial [Paenibacillus sp. FSL H8-237]
SDSDGLISQIQAFFLCFRTQLQLFAQAHPTFVQNHSDKCYAVRYDQKSNQKLQIAAIQSATLMHPHHHETFGLR